MTSDSTASEGKSSRIYWGLVICALAVLFFLAVIYTALTLLDREHVNKVNKRLEEKQRHPTNEVVPPPPVDKDQA